MSIKTIYSSLALLCSHLCITITTLVTASVLGLTTTITLGQSTTGARAWGMVECCSTPSRSHLSIVFEATINMSPVLCVRHREVESHVHTRTNMIDSHSCMRTNIDWYSHTRTNIESHQKHAHQIFTHTCTRALILNHIHACALILTSIRTRDVL